MKKTLISSLLVMAAVSADGALIGYWNFDSDSLVETSGFKPAGTHDGEAVGTVAYTAGPAGFGNALSLGGAGAVRVLNSNEAVGGSANLGPNPTYQPTYSSDISSSSMTISIWFQGMPGTWNPFVSKLGENANGYQLRQYADIAGAATFTLRGTNGPDDPGGSIQTLNDNQWHHLAGVWDRDAGNRYLYVDGVLDAGGSITDGSDSGSVNAAGWEYLVIGGRDQNGSITAMGANLIDEVRIYNEALTQSQVQALMVPEPTSGILAGIAGLALLSRRRR